MVASLPTAAQAAVSNTAGQMTFLPTPPPSVLENALVSNSTIFTFNEQQGVVLASALAVDINAAGVYDEADDLLPLNPPATIPAGTRIDSHLIHADSVANTPVTLTGTVTFGAEILGVIVRRTRLGASDFLGAPGTLYAGATATRILDFANGDVVVLPDMRTVQVTLQVSNGFDEVRVITRHNGPPTADAGGPYAGSEGVPVALAGMVADPDGDALSVSWSFSVTAADAGTVCTPAGTSTLNPTLTCTDDAVVVATLTADDGANAPAHASTTVTVANAAPVVGALTVPATAVALGSPVVVSAPFTDPGANDTHTATVAWGDTTSSAATVTEAGGSGTATAGHVFSLPGTYTVTLTVTDDDGATATATGTVTVNGPPSADAGGPYAGSEGVPTGLAGSATDPEGDPLAVSWSVTPAAADPGTTCTAAGTASLAPTVVCDDDAVVTAELSVSDGVNPPVASAATVTVANTPPQLGLITVPSGPIPPGSPVTISAPFTDPGANDTHTATVAWGDTTSSSATVTEAGGSGTATASHAFATPGTYTVTLVVADDNGGTATAATTLTVNAPPTADAGGPYAGPEGSPLVLTATASDPDGDALTVSWSFSVAGGPGAACTASGDTTLAPTLVCNDDATVTAILTVSDGVTAPVTATATVHVGNATPVLGAPVASATLIPVGGTVAIAVPFSDPGANDTHTATVDWGDGNVTAAAVTEAAGSGSATASHAYAAAGTYTVTVTVADDDGGTADASATVVVNGAPVAGAGGPYSGVEGSPVLLAGTATDPDADTLVVSWAFATAVADAGTTCSAIGTATLTPALTCDDDSVTTAQLTVTDGINPPVVDAATVTVANAAPVVGTPSASPPAVAVASTVTVTAAFSDPGANDTHTATVDWGDGNVTAAAVTEAAGSGSATASHAYAAAGTYTVTVTVADDDGGTASATATVAVNAPPAVQLPGEVTGTEGSPVTLTAVATDPEGDPLATTWSFQVLTADPGTTCAPSGIGALTATITCDDDADVEARLTVSDGVNPPVTVVAQVHIANAAPAVTAIGVPVTPVPVGTPITLSATFADPGGNDTHTAVVAWGDSTSSAAVVNEATGSVTASHAFTAAGTYTATLTLADDDGGTATATTATYVVVYDPSAGFVTGGGWVDTPSGSLTPGDPTDPDLTGRANFGFVARYQPNATVPSGSTEFNLKVASVNLKSTSYSWLVVTGEGTKALFVGTGTVNRSGAYGFLVSVIDGRASGQPDRFRIRIWDLGSGSVLIDTQAGAPDDAPAALAIGGGSVVIHT